MNKTYYIYEILGVKIGCTNCKWRRMKQQGNPNYRILETHTDIYVASDREIELQKQYGYKVDTIPYWKVVENRNRAHATMKKKQIGIYSMTDSERTQARKRGARHCKENRNGIYAMSKAEQSELGKKYGIKNLQKAIPILKESGYFSENGKRQGKKNVESGFLQSITSSGGKKGSITSNQTKYLCPDNHISNLAQYKRYCNRHGLDHNKAVKITD